MILEELTKIMGAIRALHSLALTGGLLGHDGEIDYDLIKRIASPLTGGTCDLGGIPTLPALSSASPPVEAAGVAPPPEPIEVLPIGGFAKTSDKKEIRVTEVVPGKKGGSMVFGHIDGDKFYCLWNTRFERECPLVADGTYTVPAETLKLTQHEGKDQFVPKFSKELSPGMKSFYSCVSGDAESGKKAGEMILGALRGSGALSEKEFPAL